MLGLRLLRQQSGHVVASRCYAAVAGNLQLIKALREKSGAPMGEVKTALEEASWDEGTSSNEVIPNFLGSSNEADGS